MIFRDDIQKVYDLLAAPERWTQGVDARMANGKVCEANDSRAACWCLAGAAIHEGVASYSRFGSGCGFPQFARALGIDGGKLSTWQDAPDRTHAEVLALLRSAMERAPVRPAQPNGGVGT